MSLATNHIIQQVILLATGAPGSSSVRNDINELYQQTNDWSLVAKLVDEYMNQLTGLNDKGVNGVIQAIANNGFSLQLNDQETQQLVDDLIGRGIDSWSKLFAYIITDIDGALGERLDYRAESANIFTDLLNGLNKDNDYNGSQAVNAAKEWIAGIGVSNESVTAANNSVQDLIARFHEGNVEGTLLDGYVAGATVFIDENGDGVQNAGERSTTSDAQGNFLFEGDLPDGQIVSIGGTDIATGQPFTGVLTAPSGATTVTPFTTLVNNLIKDGLAADIEAAESILFDAFDIPRVDLSTFDPINTALDNNASVENQNIAIKLQSATSQIMNLLNVSSALISQDSAAGSNIQHAVFSSLLDTLINATSNNQTVDLSDEATINTIIQTSASNAGVTRNIETIAAQSAAILSEINSRTQAASDSVSNGEQTTLTALSDIFKLQSITQAAIATAISNTQQSGDLTSVVSQFTGNNLTNNLDEIKLGRLTIGTNGNDGSSLTNPVSTSDTSGTSDTRSPDIVNFTAIDKAYKVGDIIAITVNYDEAVFVDTTHGTPTLTLNNASTASYVSGSGTSALVFNYVVTSGDNDSGDLNATAINLNNSTIKDSSDNNAVITIGSVNLATNNAVVVDANSPAIFNTTPVNNASAFGVSDHITLVFNEPIFAGAGDIIIATIDNRDRRVISVTDSGQVTINGSTITINPTADLLATSDYYVQVTSGAITDTVGNAYAGISDTSTLNFTTDFSGAVDTTAPLLAASTPLDGSSIDINKNIVLTFTEDIIISEGFIVISDGTANIEGGLENHTFRINLNDTSQVEVSGATVTINPAINLIAGSNYYVQIDSGAITDIQGNSYAGISDETTLNFSTDADTTAPVLISSTPGDEATGILVGSDIILTFSEDVRPLVGSVVINNGGTPYATISITDTSQVTFNGNIVTINPTVDLAASTTYNLQIGSIAISDGANVYAGISDQTTLNFTTIADSTAPTLISSLPADNATAVLENSNIVLTFSESIAVGTGDIIITDGLRNTQTISVTDNSQVTVTGSTVTINPLSELASNVIYYVQMASGVITDLAGNSYSGISDTSTLNFTTADSTAPTLSASTPADNATAVAVDSDIVLRFSENIAVGTGNIIISDGSDTRTIDVTDGTQVSVSGSVLTINPTASLNINSDYFVQMASGVINDIAGNPYTGISDTVTVNFTTASNLSLVSSAPSDNATAISVDSDIVLTFSDNVATGAGDIIISNGRDTRTISVTDSSQVTISGAVVTINPLSNLEANTTYYVQMAGGVITDTLGNSYIGISDTVTLNFNTPDTIAPTLVETIPVDDTAATSVGDGGAVDNSTAFAVDGNITLIFSENVMAGVGNIVISNGAGDIRTVDVTDTSQVSISDTTVAINLATDLIANTSYYLQIASGVITDIAGNSYAGIRDTSTLNFDTGDSTVSVPSGSVLKEITTESIEETNTYLASGDVTLTIDFASNDYSGSNFSLASFGAGDVLRFARDDGKVRDSHSVALTGSFPSYGSNVTASFRDAVEYIDAQGKVSLKSQQGIATVTLSISGLPAGLGASNFEFF